MRAPQSLASASFHDGLSRTVIQTCWLANLASAAGAAAGSMALMAETFTDCRSKEKTGEAQQANNTAERNFIIYTPGTI